MRIHEKGNNSFNNEQNATQSRNSLFWVRALAIATVAGTVLCYYLYNQWSEPKWTNFIEEQQNRLKQHCWVHTFLTEEEKQNMTKYYNRKVYYDEDDAFSFDFCKTIIDGAGKCVLECFRRVNDVYVMVHQARVWR